MKKNLFNITKSKRTTSSWWSPWAALRLACLSALWHIPSLEHTEMYDHVYVEPFPLWPTWLASSSLICNTFLFCDIIFMCCLAGVASCLLETSQTTSQTGGLNRKGDNIASNPASSVSLKPASKKELGASTLKDKKNNVCLDLWLLVAKDVTSHHQNSKSNLPSPRSKASVKTIYLTSILNAFQSLGNTIVSNAISSQHLPQDGVQQLASFSAFSKAKWVHTVHDTHSDFLILSAPSAWWMRIPQSLS